jgi:MinD superfamily P-loop ATPase
MKEIVILSGKGGTGKTSLTAAFSYLADNALFCDADVDASDLHLLMKPTVLEKHDFMGGAKAVINLSNCTKCNLCRKLCRFNAINEEYIVDAIDCEGCGVCVDLCPERVISFPQQKCGEWFTSSTRFGPMIHARLGIGEENSGKLVHLIRKHARKLAYEKGYDLILTDGPPGIGCPVIASLSEASGIVLIVEPSLSGIHDMKRVAELGHRFKIPILVCINKYDINADITKKIISICKNGNMTILGKIPYDPAFTYAMVQGMNILEYQLDSATVNTLRAIWNRIITTLSQQQDMKTVIQCNYSQVPRI